MDCLMVVDALIEGFRVRRIHVDGGSSSEVMYEHCFRNLSYRTRSRLKESRIPLVGFLGEASYPLGVIDLEVTMGETGMRILGAVASTIHSMIKFPTSNGIATIATTRETLRECTYIEEAQALSRHACVTDPTLMQTSSEVANPRVSLALGKKPPMSSVEEKIVVNDNYQEQLVTIGGGLSAEYRHALIHTLRKNIDIFAWTPTDMTGIPRVVTEQSLDTYPHIEPKVQKKRSLAPDRRKVVTNEVNEWLKAGIVRRVRYPSWVSNPVLVKKVDASWRMCIDFKDLNKACPKDLYPFPEIDWKIESLMGFQYKCFLDAYKGYHQIHMTKKDEEKMAFHTEEGVFYYTKMPFGLKNAGATYQRLVDSAFKEQIGVNLEAYVDDMVIKNTLKKCTNKKDFKWTEAAEAAFLEMKKLVSELPTLTTLKKGETLMMYLAAANEAVSAVLFTKRDGRKMPIHYPDQASVEQLGASGRLAKWAVELGAYGITYVPRVAVKGQVLADFLADTSTEINATPEVASTPRMKDIIEYSNARENLTPGPRAWILYTNGASNNGGSGYGLILIALDDVEYSYALRLNFSNSNNEAKYEALLVGLRIAMEMQVKDIHAFVDSKLVASQVEGSYEAKGNRKIKYQEKVLELAGAFNRFRITHIPRVENRKVDALSKLVAVQFDHLSKEVLMEVLNECSVEAQEVNMAVEEEGPTWMTPIRNYLEKGVLPEDPVDARILMEKVRNYTMEDRVLYRKSYLVPLMRDARELIRACDDCQAHASVPRLPKANMISVTSTWPFMKWGMDIVRPLSEGLGRMKYLIMATDYFTTWMEAKPLATITGKQVVNFTWDNIICRFGIPATIIIDNGTQFV
ncbi:reverse transcriptase domain-containing protein [Tanacetum coccineum]